MERILLRIMSKRKESKLTQEDMAKKLGISAVSYSKKETGKCEFTLGEFKKIAEITNTDVSYFFAN